MEPTEEPPLPPEEEEKMNIEFVPIQSLNNNMAVEPSSIGGKIKFQLKEGQAVTDFNKKKVAQQWEIHDEDNDEDNLYKRKHAPHQITSSHNNQPHQILDSSQETSGIKYEDEDLDCDIPEERTSN